MASANLLLCTSFSARHARTQVIRAPQPRPCPPIHWSVVFRGPIEPLLEVQLMIARRGNGRRMLAQPDATHVALDGVCILERAAELHLGAASRAGANVDLEDPHQELRPAVVLDLLLVDCLRVKALARLRDRGRRGCAIGCATRTPQYRGFGAPWVAAPWRRFSRSVRSAKARLPRCRRQSAVSVV